MEVLVLFFATAYVVAWWSAIWLFLGRPRLPASSPLIAMLVLWLGITGPLFVHEQIAVVAVIQGQAAVPAEMRLMPYVWAGLPVPVLALYGACSLMQEALRRPWAGGEQR